MGGLCKRKPLILDFFRGDLPLKTDMDKIPKDQFLCPECGENCQIPEILSIHADNNYIEIKCKECGEYIMLIEDFLEMIKNSKYTNLKAKCQVCQKEYQECQKEDQECSKKAQESQKEDQKCPKIVQKFPIYRSLKYCFECKKDFCPDCWKDKHVVKTGEGNKKKKKIIKHDYIPYTKKSSQCLIHRKDYIYYCEDCEENICDKDEQHKEHEKKKISDFVQKACNLQKTILEKNRILSMIVKHNQNAISNYNIERKINLYNSISDENERNNSKEFELMMYRVITEPEEEEKEDEDEEEEEEEKKN